MKSLNTFLILIIASLLITASFSLFASGFRLPESSVTGMSLSNAVVADNEQPGALIYNPALMTANETQRLINAGIINISLDAEVTPNAGTPAESQGESNVQLPSFFYKRRLNSQWSWGVGLHAPFGLESKWPDETFASFAGPLEGAEPEASKLELVNLTPNVAYQLDSHNSIAFGINYYIVKELVFNTQSAEIDADGDDFGYTLAYYYNRGPWSFGATLRSSVDIHVKGNIVAGVSGNAEADIEMPRMIQIGLRNRVNNHIAVEFDVERTYWSNFGTVEINTTHPLAALQTITSDNHWKDVNAYRLGVTYQLNNATQLYFGYTLDKSPVPDSSFSARIPDADRQLFSAGIGHQFQNDWKIEAGAMLVRFDDRTVNNSTPLSSADANGTSAYNGKYESEALLIGVGFNKTFTH